MHLTQGVRPHDGNRLSLGEGKDPLHVVGNHGSIARWIWLILHLACFERPPSMTTRQFIGHCDDIAIRIRHRLVLLWAVLSPSLENEPPGRGDLALKGYVNLVVQVPTRPCAVATNVVLHHGIVGGHKCCECPQVCTALARALQAGIHHFSPLREGWVRVDFLEDVCSYLQPVVCARHWISPVQVALVTTCKIVVLPEHVVELQAAITTTGAVCVRDAVVETQPNKFSGIGQALILRLLVNMSIYSITWLSCCRLFKAIVALNITILVLPLIVHSLGCREDSVQLAHDLQRFCLCPICSWLSTTTVLLDLHTLCFCMFPLQER
mmetsp:Transcript_32367/g.59187  ORF Transcript_32367/g.59187 Transcript_32367/m.59187 type:complete len:323 (-) Transcript_32367:199-1167(-)